MHPLLLRLHSGDRRDLGATDEVVADLLALPEAELAETFDALFEGLFVDEALIRSRAIHVVERVTRQRPKLLRVHKRSLLGSVPQSDLWAVRAQWCLIVPRLALSEREIDQVVTILHGYLNDQRSFVRTAAMQGFADLSRQHPPLWDEIKPTIQQLTATGSAAMRARGRKLLKEMP